MLKWLRGLFRTVYTRTEADLQRLQAAQDKRNRRTEKRRNEQHGHRTN